MPARMDYSSCEPFRAWNRVEPRVRKEEFDRALRCEVHDALWMLTRQWQFGEFKGEDTGSAIFARTLIKSSHLTRYRSGNEAARSYSDEMPLEVLVESEVQTPDYRLRIQAGRRWLAILDDLADTYNASRGTSPLFELALYRDQFIAQFEFSLPDMPAPTPLANDHLTDIQTAKQLTNPGLALLIGAVHKRALDGLALYDEISFSSLVARDWAAHVEHQDVLEQAANLYKGWVDGRLAKLTNASTAWNPAKLEYGFECAAPDHDGGHTALIADEYYQGRLDWYSFDVDANPGNESGLLNTSADDTAAAIKEDVVTFIPSPAEFSGMPNARWWEFEDGQVDLGNITADVTDLPKIVLTEFALIYGNDWFVLPCPATVGSISEISGIVVSDVFGQQTLIEPATQGQTDDWSSWGLFNLSPRESGVASSSQPADTRLFLAPAIHKVQESEPIEEALFVRDELANLVWGIETIIPDLIGRGFDGHVAAVELEEFWQKLQGIDPDADPEIHVQALFKYTLSNTVPENWIPFTAVHKNDGQNRAIRLQRASMPRLYFGDFAAVRPRTDLLRYGMENDPSQFVSPFVNPSHEEQSSPFYINEEEVTQAGVKLTSSYQRTRWFDGRIYSWYGRRKAVGRGNGSSGLAYDLLETVKKNKSSAKEQ